MRPALLEARIVFDPGAPQVAVMLSGVLQQVGSPIELYNNPANLFVAGFIGSPGMNFMPATLNNGSVHLPMAPTSRFRPRFATGLVSSPRAAR